MIIYHGSYDGIKDVFHLRRIKLIPGLSGNPVFTIISSVTKNHFSEFPNTLRLIRQIGRWINSANDCAFRVMGVGFIETRFIASLRPQLLLCFSASIIYPLPDFEKIFAKFEY